MGIPSFTHESLSATLSAQPFLLPVPLVMLFLSVPFRCGFLFTVATFWILGAQHVCATETPIPDPNASFMIQDATGNLHINSSAGQQVFANGHALDDLVTLVRQLQQKVVVLEATQSQLQSKLSNVLDLCECGKSREHKPRRDPEAVVEECHNSTGVYDVNLEALNTTIPMYCEKGWLLIQNFMGPTSQTPCSTNSPPQLSQVNNTKSCGYLSESIVRHLAMNLTRVKLVSDDQTTYSNGSSAIDALRNSTHWMGAGPGGYDNAKFDSDEWCWEDRDSCAGTNWPFSASLWPNMFHASCVGQCVHWHIKGNRPPSRTASYPRLGSSTWLG